MTQLLDLSMYTEEQVYMLYEVCKNIEKELEKENQIEMAEDLAICKEKIKLIENYSEEKRAEGIRWSLTSLYQDSKMNPTLSLEFYPGTESYKKYGRSIEVNVEYSDQDLEYIFTSIKTNAIRVTGQLKFKIMPDSIEGEINTGDIFAIQSRL